jgi:hypothetical protein
MSLPIFKDPNRNLMSMQLQWSTAINPLLNAPLSNGTLLTGIQLKSGANVINTMLGRQAQGWMIVDTNAPVTVYRSQPFNNLTLTLVSSGIATVNLYIF